MTARASCAAAGQLFRKNDGHREVSIGPAVFGGVLYPEQPQLTHTAKERSGNLALLLPFVDVRGDLFLDETPYGAPKKRVLFVEMHGL